MRLDDPELTNCCCHQIISSAQWSLDITFPQPFRSFVEALSAVTHFSLSQAGALL